MRRRFGRGRRGKVGAEARGGRIDAARSLERIAAEGVVPARSLEPVADEGVPDDFAALGRGETEAGTPVLVGFSPSNGADAALAVLALAQRLAADGSFEGEAIAVAPQWSIAARRRIALVGETPFRFSAVAATALAENGPTVEFGANGEPAVLPARMLARRIDRAEDRDVFLRALASFEGLAAKHGGVVRGIGPGAELVLLARRVAVLRAESDGVTLETLLPERSGVPLRAGDLAAGMDRLEGELRKRLNDRRSRSNEEGLRAELLPGVAAAARLRGSVFWPHGGSDPEVLDLAGVGEDGRPVVAALRSRATLSQLGPILDAALALRPALPALFAAVDPPLRLDALGLLLGAETFDDAVLRVLPLLAIDHAIYDIRGARAGERRLLLRGATAAATPPVRETRSNGSRRGRGRRGAGRGGPGEPRERPFEEVSLFDLDAEGSAGESGGEDANRSRRRGRGRGRRRGRRSRSAGDGESAAEDEAEPAPVRSREEEIETAGAPDRARSDESPEPERDVEALLEEEEGDLTATLAPIDEDAPDPEEAASRYEEDEEGEASEESAEEVDPLARERAARREARLSNVEPEPQEAPRLPRGRAALVAQADRNSVVAAVLLARDLRLVEGFWVYPQAELMTFFRSIATDLRGDTPIYLVGFAASPARDAIQAAALYSGRLAWFDHHDWPPEDLESMRSAIGAENLHVDAGSGSSVPAVLAQRSRRSRFSDKLVELVTGRFTQHDYERWGRLWWHRLGELAGLPGEHRNNIQPLLAGRPSDLAKEAAAAAEPPFPAEVEYVAGRDFRLVHFGGYALVIVPVPPALDPQLTARVARERFAAPISLAMTEGEELIVLGADDSRGRRGLDLGGMLAHLAAKHEWIEALRDEDHVARMRVRDLASRPERLEEVIGEVAMGRSILEG